MNTNVNILSTTWISFIDCIDEHSIARRHTIYATIASTGVQLADMAEMAEAILAYERKVDIAEHRTPRRRPSEPCPCGYPGAVLIPGPHHLTICTLWRKGI